MKKINTKLVLRTPEERFTNLPEFPFEPHYVEINGLRVHYLDEGQGEVILCLHGEPTWSFLYRKVIPFFSANYRVLAMDFIGFGRSDKFTNKDDYSFQLHCDVLTEFIRKLELKQITLVVQDWGGLIGLTVATEIPEFFSRLVIMNTGLPIGEERQSKVFFRWRRFIKISSCLPFLYLPIGKVMRFGMAHGDMIPPDVIKGYEAPFPNGCYKAGALAWPLLVPIHPEDPVAFKMRKTRAVLSKWTKPVLVMFSDSDPITRNLDVFFRKLIPTAKDQPQIIIRDAGHFLQEEKGEELARHVLEFIARTPVKYQ